MTIREFIRQNRENLDIVIQGQCPGAARNDGERRMWIMNDEGLYLWARAEGVRI